MSDKLIVYNYLHKPLAVLNDNSENRARNIEEELKIDGVSILKFELPLNSSKWHYVVADNIILYKSQMYIVQIPNISKSTSSSMITVECHHVGSNLEGKLNEAYGDTDLIGKTIKEMCDVILVGSGWILGDVDVPNSMKRGLIVKEQSIMSNIKKMGELFDCSFVFDATLDYKKIHFRRSATDNLMVVREGVNMNSLTVNIDKSGLITRLLVFGGSDPITNRPITVFGATVKDTDGNVVLDELGQPVIYDKTYIEDYSYYLQMGYEQSYIDAHPEYFLKESILTLSDYIDKDDLLTDSMRTLKDSSQPRIDVTFDMSDKIDNDNMFLHTPQLNEMIYVYSKEINDKLNIKTTVGYYGNMFQLKVNSIKTNSDKPESCSVTTKNYSQFGGIVQTLITNAETINRLVQSDGTISTNRLQGFIDILQTKINSTESHWYTDDSGNLVFENSLGTEALILGGGMFGIANSKLPDGSWNWRTFGTGGGFTADEILTGTLNADLVRTGVLSSYDGSSWMDLDTGYFNFANKVIFDVEGFKILIGSKTIEEYTSDAINSIQVGGRNLLLKSDIEVTNSSYLIQTYNMTEKMIAGGQYTIKLWGILGAGKTSFTPYLNGGTTSLGDMVGNGDGTFSLTFNGLDSGVETGDFIEIYTVPFETVVGSAITKISLEKGNIATDYTIAPEDVDASIVDAITTTSTVFQSNLEAVDEAIRLAVSETYTSKTDLDSYKTIVSTSFKETAEAFDLNFKTITDNSTTKDGETQTKFEEINKYIRFIDGNILLGDSLNEMTLKVQKDRIVFSVSGIEVAYFANNRMYITDGEFTNSMRVGNFAFTPRTNGNLSFGKVN